MTSHRWTVLVTGSRDWTDVFAVHAALVKQLKVAVRNGKRLHVIHGGHTSGADAITDEWCRSMVGPSVSFQAVKAEWNRDCDSNCHHRPRTDTNGNNVCSAAGPLRNQKMVDMSPDVCLAFLLPTARGTRDCVARAEKASIPVLKKTA